MNYQFPKKEYNEEKYSKYLTELGFRELTQQDADRLQGDLIRQTKLAFPVAVPTV